MLAKGVTDHLRTDMAGIAFAFTRLTTIEDIDELLHSMVLGVGFPFDAEFVDITCWWSPRRDKQNYGDVKHIHICNNHAFKRWTMK